jgi:hypothetical protein
MVKLVAITYQNSFSYITVSYIDDVLSLNNSRFGDFVDRIYPIEFEIKDTTDTDRSTSYLDLHLEMDSEGRLRAKHYHKRNVIHNGQKDKQRSTKHTYNTKDPVTPTPLKTGGELRCSTRDTRRVNLVTNPMMS